MCVERERVERENDDDETHPIRVFEICNVNGTDISLLDTVPLDLRNRPQILNRPTNMGRELTLCLLLE